MERLSANNSFIFEKFLSMANGFVPNTPRLMVDFGCSSGAAMMLFKKNGWDVFGIEILPSAQHVLDERNLPWATNMANSGLAKYSVDVVIMSDCIYYLADPVETLTEICAYLKPGGRLFLRHPTRAGLIGILATFNKTKALSADIWGRHVHLFSRRSTELTLKSSGFAMIQWLKERGYQRPLKNEIVHQIVSAADMISLGRLDLTLSWLVVAKK